MMLKFPNTISLPPSAMMEQVGWITQPSPNLTAPTISLLLKSMVLLCIVATI